MKLGAKKMEIKNDLIGRFRERGGDIYLALVHFPVTNKLGEIVTTSVTNMDVHDIARSCRSFGISRYFIVTPIQRQHQLLQRILGYWETDHANNFNPDRFIAINRVQLVNSIDESLEFIKNEQNGVSPLIVTTSAVRGERKASSFIPVLQQSMLDRKPILLLFGTGFGLAKEVMERADFFLNPIDGMSEDGYNHLSVRSAVAIYCEKLKQGIEAVLSGQEIESESLAK
jgi:hypothetical protein